MYVNALYRVNEDLLDRRVKKANRAFKVLLVHAAWLDLKGQRVAQEILASRVLTASLASKDLKESRARTDWTVNRASLEHQVKLVLLAKWDHPALRENLDRKVLLVYRAPRVCQETKVTRVLKVCQDLKELPATKVFMDRKVHPDLEDLLDLR